MERKGGWDIMPAWHIDSSKAMVSINTLYGRCSSLICDRFLSAILIRNRVVYPINYNINSFDPHFNSLSNDKILDGSKLKAFADDKMNVI